MNSRERTPDDIALGTLPTRSVRVTRGRVTLWIEMGSGRASQVAVTLPDDDEWRRIMESRAAVRQS